MKNKKPIKVWVCKKCLRVVKDKFGKPGPHATAKGRKDYCDGTWIRKMLF